MTPQRLAPHPDRLLDEHLLLALRHAPDHAENAPADLSACIRAEAHKAALETAAEASAKQTPDPIDNGARPTAETPRHTSWWAAWFGRPYAFAQAGTAIAGLLVATVLWVGRDDLAPHTPDLGQVPLAQTEMQSATAARMSLGAPQNDSPPTPSAVAFARQTAKEPRATLDNKPPTPEASLATAMPPAALHRQARVPEIANTPPASTVETPQAQLRSATAKPAESVTAVMPASPTTAAAQPAEAVPTPSQVAASRRVDATPQERQEIAAAMARSSGALAMSLAPPTTDPSTRTALRFAASRATHWQAGDGSTQVFLQPVHGAWLNALAAAIGGQDREVPIASSADALEVIQLRTDDASLGRLWLTRSLLRWCDDRGKCREASVEPARLQELLATLPR